MDEFDYVIVGGGTAGCVLAARLGAEPGVSVCLLEAGPKDSHPLIHIPAGFFKLVFDSPYTWRFESEPGPYTNGRRIPMPQGRVLGGSGSINGMIYNRGQAADYDLWSKLGNAGWSYPEILPYFKRSERREGGDSNYRGLDGQLPVTDMAWDHPLAKAFMQGGQELGLPLNPDYNGASQYGVGTCQSTVDSRRRKSSARAFLYPMLKNGSVDLRTGVHVLKVVLEGKRAVGVSCKRGDTVSTVRARREVIVTAGAINSPKLLQVSGIGSGDHLQSVGIPVLHDLPGVGENLRDHFGARLVARVKPGVRTLNETARGARLLWQISRWAMGRGSVLHLGPIQAYLFGKSQPELSSPDFTIGLTSAMSKLGVPAKLDENSGLTLGGWQSRPNSSGYVRAASMDPFALPKIQPNYLTDEADRRVFIAAMKMSQRLLKTDALSSLIEQTVLPSEDITTDEEWIDFGRAYGASSYHYCGTCKMGAKEDRESVVDSELRVHGLSNLRVADSSVMPTSPSGNTNAPTMMIAEKAAEMILTSSHRLNAQAERSM